MDPKTIPAALTVGAIAQEVMRPQRVRDLEAFFKQYPDAKFKVEQLLGFGVVHDAMTAAFSALQTAPDLSGLNLNTGAPILGGLDEAGNPGPEQGPQPEPI